MKTLTRAAASIVAVTLLAGALSGCAQPRKMMFKQEFVEDKGVKHIRNPNTGEYVLRVCEYDDSGKRTSCKDTTILVEQESQSLL